MYSTSDLYYIGEELAGYLGESSLGGYTFLVISSWTKIELTPEEASLQVTDQPVKPAASKSSETV